MGAVPSAKALTFRGWAKSHCPSVVPGAAQRTPVDSVVLAIGAEADDRVATALAASGVPVQRVGDCAGVNYIEGAMHDGNRAGRTV